MKGNQSKRVAGMVSKVWLVYKTFQDWLFPWNFFNPNRCTYYYWYKLPITDATVYVSQNLLNGSLLFAKLMFDNFNCYCLLACNILVWPVKLFSLQLVKNCPKLNMRHQILLSQQLFWRNCRLLKKLFEIVAA